MRDLKLNQGSKLNININIDGIRFTQEIPPAPVAIPAVLSSESLPSTSPALTASQGSTSQVAQAEGPLALVAPLVTVPKVLTEQTVLNESEIEKFKDTLMIEKEALMAEKAAFGLMKIVNSIIKIEYNIFYQLDDKESLNLDYTFNNITLSKLDNIIYYLHYHKNFIDHLDGIIKNTTNAIIYIYDNSMNAQTQPINYNNLKEYLKNAKKTINSDTDLGYFKFAQYLWTELNNGIMKQDEYSTIKNKNSYLAFIEASLLDVKESQIASIKKITLLSNNKIKTNDFIINLLYITINTLKQKVIYANEITKFALIITDNALNLRQKVKINTKEEWLSNLQLLNETEILQLVRNVIQSVKNAITSATYAIKSAKCAIEAADQSSIYCQYAQKANKKLRIYQEIEGQLVSDELTIVDDAFTNANQARHKAIEATNICIDQTKHLEILIMLMKERKLNININITKEVEQIKLYTNAVQKELHFLNIDKYILEQPNHNLKIISYNVSGEALDGIEKDNIDMKHCNNLTDPNKCTPNIAKIIVTDGLKLIKQKYTIQTNEIQSLRKIYLYDFLSLQNINDKQWDKLKKEIDKIDNCFLLNYEIIYTSYENKGIYTLYNNVYYKHIHVVNQCINKSIYQLIIFSEKIIYINIYIYNKIIASTDLKKNIINILEKAFKLLGNVETFADYKIIISGNFNRDLKDNPILKKFKQNTEFEGLQFYKKDSINTCCFSNTQFDYQLFDKKIDHILCNYNKNFSFFTFEEISEEYKQKDEHGKEYYYMSNHLPVFAIIDEPDSSKIQPLSITSAVIPVVSQSPKILLATLPASTALRPTESIAEPSVLDKTREFEVYKKYIKYKQKYIKLINKSTVNPLIA